MQLVLGNYIKNQQMSLRLAKANGIINWFNNHSIALHLLYAEQHCTADQARALIRPCITWWTSHIMAIGQLIQLEIPYKTIVVRSQRELETAAGTKCDAIAKAQQILAIIQNQGFWDDMS
ncbi:uncharacterized protein EI90DRAFT_3177220 [Cantharellus anzutake]|uniref:uncharacterized protein n=1 Tax=Cantharellus anzutake TaxID=1750568 RepID=UPI0019067673|nr:uncharacterized protein EI90DRAFT_3177220 [Cantharellus anzutake]KAF8314890.1 hypothetical protein EI90DRAFT_3177220 [Cantharellus anzutake]